MHNISINLRIKYNNLNNATLVPKELKTIEFKNMNYFPKEFLFLYGNYPSDFKTYTTEYNFEENKHDLNYCIRHDEYEISNPDLRHLKYFALTLQKQANNFNFIHQDANIVLDIINDTTKKIIDVIELGKIKEIPITNLPPKEGNYDPLNSKFLKIPENRYGLAAIDFHSIVNEFHQLYEISAIYIDRTYLDNISKRIQPRLYF